MFSPYKAGVNLLPPLFANRSNVLSLLIPKLQTDNIEWVWRWYRYSGRRKMCATKFENTKSKKYFTKCPNLPLGIWEQNMTRWTIALPSYLPTYEPSLSYFCLDCLSKCVSWFSHLFCFILNPCNQLLKVFLNLKIF